METVNRILGDLRALVPEVIVDALASLRAGDGVLLFGVLLLAFLGIRSAVRLVFAKGARRRYEAEITRLELRIAAAKAEAEIKGRADLLNGASEFLRQLRGALASGTAEDELDLPLEWLDDVRPTLAEAYTLLARHALFTGESAGDLAHARRLAWGALAADVEPEMIEDVMEAIQEAEVHNIYEGLNEPELLAWKIGRLSTETGFDAVAAGVLEKNRHRIGGTMLISGWEPDEIRAAALSGLDWAEPETGSEAAAIFLRSGGGSSERREDAGARAGGVIVQINKAAEPFRPERPVAHPRKRSDLARLGGRTVTGARALRIRANAAHEAALAGDHAKAEAEFREVWQYLDAIGDKGDAPLDALTARHNMAFEMARQGRHAQAAVHYRAVLERLAKLRATEAVRELGLSTRHDLAETLARENRHGEAESEFSAVWEARSAAPDYGPLHPVSLWSKFHMLGTREALERRTA